VKTKDENGRERKNWKEEKVRDRELAGRKRNAERKLRNQRTLLGYIAGSTFRTG